jgi:hypothetical protein
MIVIEFFIKYMAILLVLPEVLVCQVVEALPLWEKEVQEDQLITPLIQLKMEALVLVEVEVDDIWVKIIIKKAEMGVQEV